MAFHSMDTLVSFQGAAIGKAFFALLAWKWLLTRVVALMISQVACLGIGFVAQLA